MKHARPVSLAISLLIAASCAREEAPRPSEPVAPGAGQAVSTEAPPAAPNEAKAPVAAAKPAPAVTAAAPAPEPSAEPAGPPRLTDVRKISPEGVFLAPRFGPDGAHVLVTGPKFAGIRLLDTAAKPGAALEVSDEPYVGYAARWTKDGAGIVSRNRAGAELLYRLTEGGGVERVATGRTRDPKRAEAPVHAYAKSDAIYVVLGSASLIIARGDDRYYDPVLAPGLDAVAYEGLETGLSVYTIADGEKVHIGRGNHPAWLPDGTGLLYDVSTDDGQRLTGSEIWLWDRKSGEKTALTATGELLETHPTAAPDGKSVAFEADGAIYVGTLVGR